MTQLEIEYRGKNQGVEVRGVSFPERLIDVIVMPYEMEARVSHKGRMIREIVSRGAFQNIDLTRRITVNRGHVRDLPVGRAVGLDPAREEGLVAELLISDTDLGTETLRLAADGILDASAGFGVMDGGETWPERGLRRLSRLWLDHIAMTPDPAYEGAKTLAVRENEPTPAGTVAVATPHLDVVRGWRLADRYALID